MSSHHFVKEGQEVPLVVLNWNASLENIAKELLEWQPKFIVVLEILDLVLLSGLKPDAVLGTPVGNYDFLAPLEIIDNHGFWSKPKDMNILCDNEIEETIPFFDYGNVCMYTPKYKLFKCMTPFKKWMPLDKKAYTLDVVSGHKIELIREENATYLFEPCQTLIYIEEL